MVLILDGKSECIAHIRGKNYFLKKWLFSILANALNRSSNRISSHVHTYFWITIGYKCHGIKESSSRIANLDSVTTWPEYFVQDPGFLEGRIQFRFYWGLNSDPDPANFIPDPQPFIEAITRRWSIFLLYTITLSSGCCRLFFNNVTDGCSMMNALV